MQYQGETPIAHENTSSQRIEALDVVRGFALLGIFLMNIEFFNRTLNGIGMGMQDGLTGLNWWAAWFIAYFVQGKFWTIFSVLFGMGFAVMLMRAQERASPFLATYLRRILALATFGAAHYIFLWGGDILFSYAVGALVLLAMLYGTWKHGLAAVGILLTLGIATKTNELFGVAGMVAYVGLLSVYLRGHRWYSLGRFRLPLFSVILMVVGSIALLSALVMVWIPAVPKDVIGPVGTLAVFALALGWLSSRDYDNEAKRPLRLGVAVYVISFAMMSIGGAVQYFSTPATTATATAKQSTQAESEKVEKETKRKEERTKRRMEREASVANELRIMSTGTYAEAVELRARKFPGKVLDDFGFAMVLSSIFLIGTWFIRSGVMARPQDHLALFRRIALWGLPIGIGLGLAGSVFAVRATPGLENDGFQLARGLAMLGNLPACLGYISLVAWVLYRPAGSWLKLLAPVGRMTLTNYLMQSVICTLVFFGYGLGWWGLDRSLQLGFVVIVFSLQVAWSHWWLKHFRWGPMEWVWRAFTYRASPPLRRQESM